MKQEHPSPIPENTIPIPLVVRKNRTKALPGPEHHLSDPRERLERNEWMYAPDFGSTIVKADDDDKATCEDDAFTREKAQLTCVCDGVGSGVAGDFVAKTVTNLLRTPEIVEKIPSIQPLFSDHETPQTQQGIEHALKDFLKHADQRVRETFEELSIQKKISDILAACELKPGSEEADLLYQQYKFNHLTTCVLFKGWRAIDGREFMSVGNIGDSRLYRRRKGKLERMTSDDTMVEPFRKYGIIKDDGDATQVITLDQISTLLKRTDVDMKDSLRAFTLKQHLKERDLQEIQVSEIAHLVLNSLGQHRSVYNPFRCEIRTEEVEEGDEFYLCSDGVENYTDEELEQFLEAKKADQADVGLLSQDIITNGNALFRKIDDFTVVIVRYTKGKFEYTQDKLENDHPQI